MFDPKNLTNAELLAATNEYIKRAVAMLPDGRGFTVMLWANAYSTPAKEYKIDHHMYWTPEQGGEIKLQGGSCFEHANKFRLLAGMDTTPAHNVQPMLEAPQAPPSCDSIVEAQYTPITDLDDDMTF